MIHILSAGRSGSAWLCAVLTALGLDCRHDGYPDAGPTQLHVDSETGWLWHPDRFFKQCMRGDTVIILNRPKEQIEGSIATLLGKEHSKWDALFVQWERFKDMVRPDDGLHVYEVEYHDLFKYTFAEDLYHILRRSCPFITIADVERVTNLFQHFRITNKSIEQDTKDTYVRHQPQGIASGTD